jgi:hypothetical protein
MPISSGAPAEEFAAGVEVASNSQRLPLCGGGGGGVPVTLSVVLPLTAPKVALMLDDPAPTPLASPVLVIVATAGADEDQFTWLVRSRVLLSEYVPVAWNCCVAPAAMDELAGVTAIEDSEAVLVPVLNTTSTHRFSPAAPVVGKMLLALNA